MSKLSSPKAEAARKLSIVSLVCGEANKGRGLAKLLWLLRSEVDLGERYPTLSKVVSEARVASEILSVVEAAIGQASSAEQAWRVVEAWAEA